MRALYGWLVRRTDRRVPRDYRASPWRAYRAFHGIPPALTPSLPRMKVSELEQAAQSSTVSEPAFAEPIVLPRPAAPDGSPRRPLVFAVDPEQFQMAHGAWDPGKEQATHRVSELFVQIAELARRHTIEVTVLYIPTVMSALRPLVEDVPGFDAQARVFMAKSLPGRAGELELAMNNFLSEESRIVRWFATESARHGFTFVDMTPAYRERNRAALATADVDPPFLPYDIHLSVAGNDLIADVLAPLLRRQFQGAASDGSGRAPDPD
jgi:hypothetical protein